MFGWNFSDVFFRGFKSIFCKKKTYLQTNKWKVLVSQIGWTLRCVYVSQHLDRGTVSSFHSVRVIKALRNEYSKKLKHVCFLYTTKYNWTKFQEICTFSLHKLTLPASPSQVINYFVISHYRKNNSYIKFQPQWLRVIHIFYNN